MSIVYLIGAGPGHPELIAVRGVQCLRTADVVLYDNQVHPRLLRYARREAERIAVGVTTPKPFEHEAICYLLAEKAREGKVVARLKWGDPFLFDHGGAEALFLHEQGIPFEVVPGIPAALGAATYAGVPLTFPGTGDTLTFIRGSDEDGKRRTSIDWKSLADVDGTIVCYAGPGQLPNVMSALLSHGRPNDDAAAVVYDGTLPSQETKLGALGDLASALKESSDRRTAILIVGKVAALSQHLGWFGSRPLFGRRVLVTRPREQAAELVGLLESLGADPVEAPLIRICPPLEFDSLDQACARVREFDWIVFSSVNAVDAFIDRLLVSPLDLRALGRVKLCAVGPSTGERLRHHGLKVDLLPGESRAEAIVAAMTSATAIEGLQVCLPRADIGREVVGEELRKQGAIVTEVVAYRTVPVEPGTNGEPDIYRMLLERRIDVVTFTSPSAVRSFVKALGAEPAIDLMRTTLVASIGPVTADAAARCGIVTTIMPAHSTIPALVEAIVDHYKRPS
jgi:uroporphyrinogen III methyltransferase/synthase